MTFPDFLQTLRTWDPQQIQPREFPNWEYVIQLANDLESSDRLLVVKSRQMMVTWVGCAFILFRALTDGPGVHLVISKEERSAKEMIDRIRFLYEHSQRDTEAQEFKASKTEITFPQLESRIVSLPAAPYAVRGQSPRTLFWDEMAFTPNDEEIWAAVKPAVDAGGRFFGVSTPNGPLGVFYNLIHDNSGRFSVNRIHYDENPERSSEWELKAKAGLSDACWRREQELSFEGAEGRVYDQFDPEIHLLKEEYMPGQCSRSRLFRSIDFGYRRPAVIWAEELEDGSLIIFAELQGNKWGLRTLMERIYEIDQRFGLSERDFTWTACDPAGAANSDFGISSVDKLGEAGYKLEYRTSNINPGVETVRALLQDASGTVSLHVDPRCTRLHTAFEGYAWDDSGDLPRKDGEHDHLMDALRYLVINLPRFKNVKATLSPRIDGMHF
ncbi:terminase-like family protein [bacterium BMS3Bbin04]|nr:terminase-like family protein [bacterium BMS3Bbin04]